MNNLDYIDEEIQKKFLQLQEEFGQEIAELKEKVIIGNETNIAMVKMVKSIAKILNKRIDQTNEFMVESIKDVVKLMGDIQL